MRNTRWLRFSLASTVTALAALGLTMVACSDDETPVTPPPNTQDANTGDSSQTGDSATGTDAADAAPKPANAKIVVVNAATDFGPGANIGTGAAAQQAIRICFAVGASAAATQVTPIPPQPHIGGSAERPVGIYIGTGGVFKAFGLDLQPLAIVPYIMNAAKLRDKGIIKPAAPAGDPGPTCDEILKPGGMIDGGSFVENEDYWKLPAIAPQTLKAEKTFALVLTGCTADATSPAAKCGPATTAPGAPNYEPTPGTFGVGNLTARVYELDRPATTPADAIGTQFIHASAPAAAFFAVAGPGGISVPVVAGYAKDNSGTVANMFKPVPGKGASGATAYAELTALTNVTGVTVADDLFTANPQVPDIGSKLTDIQAISFAGNAPPAGAEMRAGAAFTFFAVGDPTVPTGSGATFNPRGFHYLAFPNNPPVEPYTP